MAELLEGLGHNIRRLREERDWNQTELGFRADMSPSIVSLIENGKRNPSTATLGKIAGALGVEVVDLFPKASAPLELSLHDVLNDLRRTTERFGHYHAIQKALDEYREGWEERLDAGDVDKTAIEEGGRALAAFWPAVVAAAHAEMAEADKWDDVKPEEAAAQSVLLPAIARFQALCDRVNSTYREKFQNARVYVFPHREAS